MQVEVIPQRTIVSAVGIVELNVLPLVMCE